jgi:hypothetical protein
MPSENTMFMMFNDMKSSAALKKTCSSNITKEDLNFLFSR